MSEQSFLLQGGLDQESPVAAIPPGRVLSVSNYEAMSRGYQRTQGYERFDGQPRPSDAIPYIILFDQGAIEIEVGDTLTGQTSGATAVVLAAPDMNAFDSDWDGTGAGRVPVAEPVGTFTAGENLRVGGVTHARFGFIIAQPSSAQDDLAAEWRLAAADHARSFITEVPGNGPVRGVLYYNDTVFAWRDGTEDAIAFDGGSSEITSGMTITGLTSAATATVVRVVLDDDSGEWLDGAATGTLILSNITGVFQNNESLDGGATGLAVADGVVFEYTVGLAYRATDTGWEMVDLGTSLSFDTGSDEITVGMTITGGTSGATGKVRSIILTPDSGEWLDGGAAGTLELTNVTGAFVDNEVLDGGTSGLAMSASASVVSHFAAGGRYEFKVHNFYGSTGTERAYGVNGVSPAFDFDGESVVLIQTGMPVDTPFLIQAHKKHLFLGFPGGSLQHSAPGDPLSFDAVFGAAELGLGHELTGIVPNAGGTLTIATEKNISALYGNDATDWQLETLSTDDTGAIAHTMQRIGQTIYLDERGVRSITATSAFGGFKMGSYTTLIQKALCDKRLAGVLPVASMVVKPKDQYLLFFDDNSGISIYFGRKQPEAMLFTYPFAVFCTYVAEISGVEREFVGAEDGFVYELNRGTSFDGEPIVAFVQMAFGHQGGPRVLKRYHKAVLDLIANPRTEISAYTQFDLGDGTIQQFGTSDMFDITGGGGQWASTDVVIATSPTLARGEVYTPGLGTNMSLVISSNSAEQESEILQALTIAFTPRTQKR